MVNHDPVATSIASTLTLLQQEFPNLEWKGYTKNTDRAHGFKATFCEYWSLTVEVLPIGCRAVLDAGRLIISESPNEQDYSLEFVVAHVRREWDAIAHALSANPSNVAN
jgi:hypothetical protein